MKKWKSVGAIVVYFMKVLEEIKETRGGNLSPERGRAEFIEVLSSSATPVKYPVFYFTDPHRLVPLLFFCWTLFDEFRTHFYPHRARF